MSAETEEWVDQVQAEIRRKAQHGPWSDMDYQIYNANYDLGHITYWPVDGVLVCRKEGSHPEARAISESSSSIVAFQNTLQHGRA